MWCMLIFTLFAAGVKAAVVARDNINLVLEQAKECPVLKYVISIDHTVLEDVAITTLAKETNIELRSFDEVMVSYMQANCMCCLK